MSDDEELKAVLKETMRVVNTSMVKMSEDIAGLRQSQESMSADMHEMRGDMVGMRIELNRFREQVLEKFDGIGKLFIVTANDFMLLEHRVSKLEQERKTG